MDKTEKGYNEILCETVKTGPLHAGGAPFFHCSFMLAKKSLAENEACMIAWRKRGKRIIWREETEK